jgi:hypothetical protein
MGEYAIRKSDKAEIKIGTCESMYYLRLEDKNKVNPMNGSSFGHYWRLPLPEEDSILPGDYKEYNKAYRLYRKVKSNTMTGQDYCEDFTDPDTIKEPGTMQFHNNSGLLVNVKCYHGEKLPENSNDVSFCWNGKGWFLELAYLRTDGDDVFPIVKCRHCDKMWRYDWNDVLPYVQDNELKLRLNKYAVNKEHAEVF